MKKSRLSPAAKFWVGIGIYALTADIYLWRNDEKTLSIQFGDWLSTKNGRALCTAATTSLVIHLFYGIPLPFQKQARIYLGGKRELRKLKEILDDIVVE